MTTITLAQYLAQSIFRYKNYTKFLQDVSQWKNTAAIYTIYNKIDQKVYIGSSLNLATRMYYHFHFPKNKNLCQVISPSCDFEIFIMEVFTKKPVLEK